MMNGSISKRNNLRIGSLAVTPSARLKSTLTSSPGTATRQGQATSPTTLGNSPRKSREESDIKQPHSFVALGAEARATDAIWEIIPS